MTRKISLISIIIPGYNEEKNIASVVQDVLKLKKQYAIEIIVIDDGSKDKTAEIAKKTGADSVISYKKNKGKGGAFRVGIDHAKGQYIIQIDADHQFQPNEIPQFIKALQEDYDIVCGTRFNKGTVEEGSVSIVNLFGNWLVSFVTTFFSGIHVTDIMAGFKGFTKEAANKLDLKTAHFGYEAEIIVKAGKLGLKVKEIPITYKKRIFGQSSLNAIRDGIKVTFTIAKMYLTFPGPAVGYGIVGKRILRVLIPIWLVITIPAILSISSHTHSLYLLIPYYIVCLIVFVSTRLTTNSRLASMISCAFFALTPFYFNSVFGSFTQIPIHQLNVKVWYSLFALLLLPFFTGFFLQKTKLVFLKKALALEVLSIFSLYLLSFILPITLIQLISAGTIILAFILSWYFSSLEPLLAQSLLLSSLLIIYGTLSLSNSFTVLGYSLFIGTYTSLLFLESVSFRYITLPMFSFKRIIRIILLSFFLFGVFLLQIFNNFMT